jgi:hypothetical protein
MWNLTGVENTALFPKFFDSMALLIMSLALTLTNKTMLLNESTVISSKLVLHYYLLQAFLIIFGIILLVMHVISSIKCPPPLLKINLLFEVLFKTPLDYKFLRIFSCAHWPHLRPYNSNKLQPRSTQCIFMGYSLCHKNYKCLHHPTGRVYFSIDVLFQEDIFPFASVPSLSIAY